MAQLNCGHCTARSTVLASPPAMVKDKIGEGGQTAVGLDPINEGVQPEACSEVGLVWHVKEVSHRM